MRRSLGLVILALTTTCPAPLSAATWVYVSEASEQQIATFSLNRETGDLTRVSAIKTDGEPGPLCSDPTGRFLFASMRSTGWLTSLRLDAETGELILVNTIDAGADPAFLATDQKGQFLITAYYRAGKVTVHAIAEDGSLSREPVHSVTTDEKAHAVAIDDSDSFVWIPHTGPNAIHQFRFDPSSGQLTNNDPAVVGTPDETGPRHLWLHPGGQFAYSSNEQGSSATVWEIDKEQGTLDSRQTTTTLPPDFTGTNACADIELTPDGRFLYVANRGHDSLARFAVDAKSGALTPLGWTPTEATPRSFNIDPSGRVLIAAGQSSGKLALFRINHETGDLQRYGTVVAGERPWWVHIVATANPQ